MKVGLEIAALAACLLATSPLSAAPKETATEDKISKAEVRAAIDRGIGFLLKSQNSNGWWSTGEHPAVTALVLTALNGDPGERFGGKKSSEINRAYDFILSSAKEDGSVHRGALINYNTALSLTALSTAESPEFQPVIQAARKYLAKSQIDMGEPGKLDGPFDGGVGYGSKYQHSDMNNTLTAIEAMRISERTMPEELRRKNPDLNWEAVARFLQNCQNLPAVNKAEWVSDKAKDHGSFVYYPGQSMAGGETNAATGKVALRSYGSISYAGLLSYIYARVGKDDPRVKAVLDWLSRNYSIEENPGMGPQGYFYYLHLMSKALTAAGVEKLKLADGTEVKWREQVTNRLLSLQKPDGSWVNAEKRWWETDANLVTAYVLLTLEMVHGHLEK